MCPRAIVVSASLDAAACCSASRAAATDIAASAFAGVGRTPTGAWAAGVGGAGAGGSPGFCGEAVEVLSCTALGASGLVQPASPTTASSKQTGMSPFTKCLLIG